MQKFSIISLCLLSYMYLVCSREKFCTSQSCQPCYYRCNTCSFLSSISCLQCAPEYFLTTNQSGNNICVPCTANCKSCSSNLNDMKCETCEVGYYLSQGSGKCMKCGAGVELCTLSSVQKCKIGYYQFNGGCFKCIQNCQICNQETGCSQCEIGYYIAGGGTIGDCKRCLDMCLVCVEGGSCLQCQAGYEGDQCNEQTNCSSNCATCYSSTCYSCSKYYLLQQGKCLPIGLLCETAKVENVGGAGGDCLTCRDDMSYMDGNLCRPYYSIEDIFTQVYITSFNGIQMFGLPSLQLSKCNLSLNSSPILFVYNQQSIPILIPVQSPIYSLKIMLRLATENLNPVIFISSNSSTFQQKLQTSNGSFIQCQQFYVSNFDVEIFSGFQGGELEVLIETSGGVGIVEILVQLRHCAIENCAVCASAYSCTMCQSPYFLQDNMCIKSCSWGFYLTESTRSCNLNCPPTTYPVFSDYSCLPCLPPCRFCQISHCLTCLPGFFLHLNNSCLQQCSPGTYPLTLLNGNGVCQICRYPCLQCLNDAFCTQCAVGYLIDEGLCGWQCSNGKYLEKGVCQKCQFGCEKCVGKEECIGCIENLFLFKGKCVQKCEDGTVAVLSNSTENGHCIYCEYPCLTCEISSNKCTSCLTGLLHPFIQVCTYSCPQMYYPSSSTHTCEPCTPPCLVCLSQTICLSCPSNLFLLNFTCASSCSEQTYAVYANHSGMCMLCVPPCASCVSIDTCSSCEGDFVLEQGVCKAECQGYRDQNQCKECQEGCIKCTSNNECSVCEGGYYMNEGQCLTNCPTHTYPHGLGLCVSCRSPCQTCSSISKCLSCFEGYYFQSFSGRCYSECPTNTYEQSQLCIGCDKSCAECLNLTNNCLECQVDYFRVSNGSCLSDCPKQFYGNRALKQCLRCQAPCQNCLSKKTCLSCIDDLAYLWLGQCLYECPVGTFLTNLSESCLACDQTCQSCDMISSNCTKCLSDLYFLLQPSQSHSSIGSCLQSCPEGYYSYLTQVCYLCQSPCKSCSNQPTSCSSCQIGFYLYLSFCLQTCPDDFYEDLEDSTCHRCSLQCSTCHTSATNCSSCFLKDSYLMWNEIKKVNQCVKECQHGYFADSLTSMCKSCGPLCLNCLSQGYCTQCNNQKYLFGYSCLIECPKQYYENENGNVCLACQSPCLACSSINDCDSCQQPLWFISSNLSEVYFGERKAKCLHQCPAGTYQLSLTIKEGQCQPCSSVCSECNDYSSCISCRLQSNRPYLQGQQCVANCSSQFYLSQSGSTSSNLFYVCLQCSKSCVQCISFEICTQCINSYLHESYCIQNCPQNYYGDPAGICLLCSAPCLTCYDNSNCKTCQQGYFLYHTFCLEHCPYDMWIYPHNRTCLQKCDFQFHKTDQRKCLMSCEKFYQSDGQCVGECSGLGTQSFINQTYGCQRCESNCSQVAYFKAFYANKGNQLLLALVFSHSIDNYLDFHYESVNCFLLEEELLENEGGSLSGVDYETVQEKGQKRLLFSTLSPTSSLYLSQFLFLLALPSFQEFSSKTGTLHTSLPLHTLVSKSYPVQNQNFLSTISHTLQSQISPVWALYLGKCFSVYILIVVVIGFAIDRVSFVSGTVEISQILHILGYIGTWGHPILEGFMKGLGFSAFYFEFLFFETGNDGKFKDTSNLWVCHIKKILNFNQCNYLANLIGILVVFAILVIVVLISKFGLFKTNSLKHKIFWNHINNFYNTFAFVLFFASYDAPLYIFVPVSIVLTFLTTILFYQCIKCIFTNSYTEQSFFCFLETNNPVNPISNAMYPITTIRRIILIIFISVAPDKVVSILSLLLFCTILIIANGVWNKPYKIYHKILPTIQCLFGIFLFMMLVIVANVQSMRRDIWEGLSWTCFIIMICFLCLSCWISGKQTFLGVKLTFLVYFQQNKSVAIIQQNGQNNKSKQNQAQHSNNTKQFKSSNMSFLTEARPTNKQDNSNLLQKQSIQSPQKNEKMGKQYNENGQLDKNQEISYEDNQQKVSYFDGNTENEFGYYDFEGGRNRNKDDRPAKYLIKVAKMNVDEQNEGKQLKKQENQ